MTTDIFDVGRVRALNDILRRAVALGRERQQAMLIAVAVFRRFLRRP